MATARHHQPNEPQWNIPGFTGHIHGKQETFGRTPVMAELETIEPAPPTLLFARTRLPPVVTPTDAKRDPCNAPAVYLPSHDPANLWPRMQASGRQERVKASTSNISLGDERIPTFSTSYGRDFSAPFDGRIRSPLHNRELKSIADLKHVYTSAFNRIGTERLDHMIHHMREHLAGKMGNANNNAFKLRKLFKMYDVTGAGKIKIEDFRQMTESCGMQLDDDSLLALFSRTATKQLMGACQAQYDPEATGELDYVQIMRLLLDDDTFKMYCAGGPKPAALYDETDPGLHRHSGRHEGQ